MKTITLPIEGMMCASCEKRVNGALGALEGVESCAASASKKAVDVTFDETKVNEAAMKTAIEEVGYDVK